MAFCERSTILIRCFIIGVIFQPLLYYFCFNPGLTNLIPALETANLTSQPIQENEDRNMTSDSYRDIPAKVILVWDNQASQMLDRSRCGKCYITSDRRKLSDIETAAVMFSYRVLVKDLPQNNIRRSSQLYVWYCLESPSNTQTKHLENNNLSFIEDYYFNATLSNRRDSTFYTIAKNQFSFSIPIEIVQSGAQGVTSNVTKLLELKSKTAVWFVSNCRSGSNAKGRLVLAQKLVNDGLDVDRFGSCFKRKSEAKDKKQFIRTIEQYRFFLAFENSYHCPGYITEKLFYNSLSLGAVPVVFGATREDYAAVAPPHSYIHVEDFHSTTDLVDYLHYLEKNETAYAEYFAWRSMKPEDVPPYGRYMGVCALCRSLYGIKMNDTRTFTEIYGKDGVKYNSHVNLNQPMEIKSINDWWYGRAGKECMAEF